MQTDHSMHPIQLVELDPSKRQGVEYTQRATQNGKSWGQGVRLEQGPIYMADGANNGANNLPRDSWHEH